MSNELYWTCALGTTFVDSPSLVFRETNAVRGPKFIVFNVEYIDLMFSKRSQHLVLYHYNWKSLSLLFYSIVLFLFLFYIIYICFTEVGENTNFVKRFTEYVTRISSSRIILKNLVESKMYVETTFALFQTILQFDLLQFVYSLHDRFYCENYIVHTSRCL